MNQSELPKYAWSNVNSNHVKSKAPALRQFLPVVCYDDQTTATTKLSKPPDETILEEEDNAVIAYELRMCLDKHSCTCTHTELQGLEARANNNDAATFSVYNTTMATAPTSCAMHFACNLQAHQAGLSPKLTPLFKCVTCAQLNIKQSWLCTHVRRHLKRSR